jgi:hypothetical protein
MAVKLRVASVVRSCSTGVCRDAPIHLRLLAGRCLEPLDCNRLGLLALRVQPVLQNRITAAVVALAQLPQKSTAPLQTPGCIRSLRHALNGSSLPCAGAIGPYTGRLLAITKYLLIVLRS